MRYTYKELLFQPLIKRQFDQVMICHIVGMRSDGVAFERPIIFEPGDDVAEFSRRIEAATKIMNQYLDCDCQIGKPCEKHMDAVKVMELRIKTAVSKVNRDVDHIVFFHSGSQYDFECKNEECPYRTTTTAAPITTAAPPKKDSTK